MTSKRVQFALAIAALVAFEACSGSRPSPTDATEHSPRDSATHANPGSEAATDHDEASVAAPSKTPIRAGTAEKGVDAATGQGSAASAVSPSRMDVAEETFPSGLVVDARLIGGPAPGPELPKDTRVLHVGDSFAGALGIELNKVLRAAGLKAKLEFEQSTYIPTWAHSAKFASLMSTFKPDLVLISLGANELENPEPEKRAPLVQRIVNSVGDTPCVWIAPVLWEGAKDSLLQVIRANVGRCVYLDSNEVVKKMPRAGDRIHPSMAARPDWAVATARWLAYHRRPTEQKLWAISSTL